MDRLTVGSALGGYRIEAVLGQGGMATVYRAVELGPLERVVALKVMSNALSHNDEYRARFLHEARTAAGLHHPNLVPIYEFNDDADRLYLAMQYVEGRDLASYIHDTDALSLADVVAIGAQVGDALDFAHFRGVVHRDVKPANVMLEASHRSGSWRAMLTDFGIAKMVDDTQLTQPGTILGSLPYAAPEVINGDEVTGAADIYSLGCTLFQMLTGQPVFVRENQVALLHAHVHAPIPSVRDLRPDLDPAIDDIMARALAKDAAERWLSCTDLIHELSVHAGDAVATGTGVRLVTGQHESAGVARPPGGRLFPPRLAGESPFAFVGRGDERRQLEDTWKHVIAGGRRTVLLSGEPGVGKTTLAGSFARDRHEAGAMVLYGRCDEDLGIPYQPWVEVFGFLTEHAHAELVRVVGDRLGELRPFLPELAGATADAADVDAAESERYSLFATSVHAIDELARTQPVLVVLDDLQWADRPTLLLLRHLLTAASNGRFMVLGTFRDSEVDDRHPLADLLAARHRDEEIARLQVRGLEDDDLIELLTSAAGHELPEEGVALAHTLRRETNGNPFFTIEILRHLAETGAIARSGTGRWQSQDDLGEGNLPVSVREVIGRRVGRLGEEVERVLRSASVIGREFDLALLAEVVELSEEATIDLLDAAVAADLVEDLSPGTFGFVHALVEHALCDGLSPTRRARLHRRVAEAIEVLAPGERLAELAYHWSEATLPQDRVKAVDSARRAGDHALAALAPEEARRWYAQALDLIDDQDRDKAVRCDLLIGLAEAQRQVGDADYRVTFFAAARLADDLGDAERLVRVALGNGRKGGFSAFGGVDDERLQLLRRALDVIGSDHPGQKAQLLARLAAELTFADADDERDAAAAEALALARDLGDDRTLLAVLLSRGDTILSPAFVAERLEIGSSALTLAERQGDQVAVFLACEVLFDTACAVGDGALADEMLERLTEIDGRLGQPELRWPARWRQAERAIIAGDLEQADQLSVDAFEIGNGAGQPDALVFHMGQIFMIRYMQGRLHEHIDLFDQLAVELTPVPIQDALYAVASFAAGRVADAARLLSERIDLLPQLPLDEQWTCMMAMWARVAGAVGDDAAASVLLELLRPWRQLFALSGVAVIGPISLYAGLLASHLGRDEADELLRDAVMAADRVRDPYHGAEARLALAARSLDRPDGAAMAAVLVRDAAGQIEGRGYAGLDAELHRLTRLLDERGAHDGREAF
jgi:hypothetical protein